MNAAIAQHLNVSESAILEIQEWAKVLWVRVRGIGARFVSKKVANMSASQKEIVVQKFKAWSNETQARLEQTKKERVAKLVERQNRVLAAFAQIDETDPFWAEVITRKLTPALILDWQFGYSGKYMFQ